MYLLYVRFPLSFQAVEEMMILRGLQVNHETIHRWRQKFGQQFANELRHRRPRTGDKWHLDEAFLKINGETYYLWRAMDQEGSVLDVLVQSRPERGSSQAPDVQIDEAAVRAPRADHGSAPELRSGASGADARAWSIARART